jgi:hypothetical protein
MRKCVQGYRHRTIAPKTRKQSFYTTSARSPKLTIQAAMDVARKGFAHHTQFSTKRQ